MHDRIRDVIWIPGEKNAQTQRRFPALFAEQREIILHETGNRARETVISLSSGNPACPDPGPNCCRGNLLFQQIDHFMILFELGKFDQERVSAIKRVPEIPDILQG